jgi:hypothetical protein
METETTKIFVSTITAGADNKKQKENTRVATSHVI